jgi:DNA replication and repair protein RecF
MALTQINLKNFRNYSDAGVDTDADLVLILGPNASGKTNFLESIYFLSRLKSFRAPDNLLVKSQEDYFKIAASFKRARCSIKFSRARQGETSLRFGILSWRESR